MLAFKCPACKTTINLPDSARGERVVCGHCGESVFVAASSEPRETREVRAIEAWPSLADIGPSRTLQRRKKSGILNFLPHLVISGVTCYAAWRMFDATVNRLPEKPATAVAVAPQKVIPRPKRTMPKRAPKAEAQPTPVAQSLPVAVPQPPAIADLPSAVSLPPSADDQLAVLANAKVDCQVEILTNAKDLTRDDEKLVWKGDVVAGLRVEKGEIQFRWMKAVPPQAEAAIRNSVVRLASGPSERFMALREPVVGEPLILDLRDSTQRVNGKCDWLPPAEVVRFGITLSGQVPVKKIDGPKLESLSVRDETIIVYNFRGDAATKVSIRTSAGVTAAVLASQYVLLTCPLQKSPRLERESKLWAQFEGERSDAARNEVQAGRNHCEAA